MTGTSGAIARATVSRTAGLPLTAVDFTDSRTRTRRDARSTHTISPTIVFEGAAVATFDAVAEDAAGDFEASSGATRSARMRTRPDICSLACTRRARSGRGHTVASLSENSLVLAFEALICP